MQFILTPNEMRLADRTAIETYKIPGELLMENAGRSVSDFTNEIIAHNKVKNPKILILCGNGNNGGDGFATARHLANKYSVRIAWIGSELKMSPETYQNYEIVNQMEIPMIHLENEDDIEKYNFNADFILDALIGVGGTEDLKGLAPLILKKVNNIHSLKIAVDIPTGLNSETGFAHPDAFIADYTITMYALKTGMLLNDGSELCGKRIIANLGSPEKIISDIAHIAFLEDSDVSFLLPSRKKISTKFDYGRVVILAGSKHYPGAAALAANAAIKIGAGLVYLLSPMIHPAVLPEIIPTQLPSDSDGYIDAQAKDYIFESIKKASVLAIGPGIGDKISTLKLISELINELPESLPLIIDADALKAIDNQSVLRKNIILTPHLGEFSRITGINRETISINANTLAQEWADKLNCTILLKHVPSIITDGDYSFWNLGGNPGMATAGSGDVLTGIIAGLVAQGLSPLEATSLGAFIHSKAGDYYANTYSQETLTSSMLIYTLDIILHSLKS
ncbi:MAG TPA: NAD(P)H-hydrate dehydratase [Candidatus Kapabacteria bacterium]|nr:NAD(P)H-hydrate dehydratase [Candidatus Kapabacteria bacterium]